MNSDQLFYLLPNASIEELDFLKNMLMDKSEDEKSNFITQYMQVRKDPQTILIFDLFGFLGVAGIHRIVLDQILLGVIYFLTGGFCLIGTIIDILNYKDITFQYNKKMASKLLLLNGY